MHNRTEREAGRLPQERTEMGWKFDIDAKQVVDAPQQVLWDRVRAITECCG